MKPTYELTGDKFEIKDRGWVVYTANTTCNCSWNDVCELVGTEVEIEGKKRKVMAVEQFAVNNQSYKPIGLAVKKE